MSLILSFLENKRTLQGALQGVDMKKKSTSKIWTQKDGLPMSDEEIKKVCHSWSASDWETYLDSTVDVKQKELLMENSSMMGRLSENLSQEDHEKVFSPATDPKNFLHLEEILGEIINQLSENQRQVLHHIFWENLSLGGASKKLGVSRVAVKYTKDRALKRISDLLLKEVIRRNRCHGKKKMNKKVIKKRI